MASFCRIYVSTGPSFISGLVRGSMEAAVRVREARGREQGQGKMKMRRNMKSDSFSMDDYLDRSAVQTWHPLNNS